MVEKRAPVEPGILYQSCDDLYDENGIFHVSRRRPAQYSYHRQIPPVVQACGESWDTYLNRNIRRSRPSEYLSYKLCRLSPYAKLSYFSITLDILWVDDCGRLFKIRSLQLLSYWFVVAFAFDINPFLAKELRNLAVGLHPYRNFVNIAAILQIFLKLEAPIHDRPAIPKLQPEDLRKEARKCE